MDGLLIVDRDRRMVHLDSGAEALLGWQNSEIRGRRVYEVFEISEAEADVAWKKERGGAVPAAKVLSLRARDGVRVSCSVLPILVRDPERDVLQGLHPLPEAPGTKRYADRLMEALSEAPQTPRAAPPE